MDIISWIKTTLSKYSSNSTHDKNAIYFVKNEDGKTGKIISDEIVYGNGGGANGVVVESPNQPTGGESVWVNPDEDPEEVAVYNRSQVDALHQSIVNSITSLSEAGYLFSGVATSETNPGTPDAKVFYIANGKGTYTNFGGLEVTEDEVVVLYWDTAWHKESTGIASQEKLSELEREVIGGEKSSWVNINLVKGTNFFVGEYYNTGSPYANKTSAAGYSCAIIPCSKGDIIRLKGIGNASAVVRFFAIVNNEYLILRKADGAISARENPYEITIEEDSAAYICVNFSGYDQNTDGVSIYETIVIEGLKTELVSLREDLSSLEGIVDEVRLVSPSNKEVSHICLVYDDEYSQDLVDICDERGIKVTFALIGNVDKDNPYWKSSALAMRKAMKNGHGCAAHGIVRGWVPSSGGTGYGIDQMNDHDALQAINLENKAFDDYGLPHYGLVAFNSYEENPHCTKLVRSNYNYLLQFITADNIPSTTDLYQLGRLNTDLSSQIDSIKSAIDVAIRNGMNVFIGGHFGKTGGEGRRTGSGVGSYSTMAQFLSLLDYIKSYIDRGLLVSMSLDNAINDIWNSATNRSVVKKVNYNLVNPPLYAMKYDDGLKICSVRGAFYIFEIQVSGTPADGSFDLLIGGSEKSSDKSLGQTLTITTSSTDSIEDVVDNICSQIYKAFTPYKKSPSSVVLFRDIFGSSFVPEVSNNTSGLNFTISVSQYGKNETWV